MEDEWHDSIVPMGANIMDKTIYYKAWASK